jgi:hypothetical protein
LATADVQHLAAAVCVSCGGASAAAAAIKRARSDITHVQSNNMLISSYAPADSMLSYHQQQQQHDSDGFAWMLSQSFVCTAQVQLATLKMFGGVKSRKDGVKEAKSSE